MGAAEKLSANVVRLAPQPGPQYDFLASTADIVIYGGAAGGGKTFALLLEPLRHYENSDFGGVIFRRTNVQIRIEGGLWDESAKLYSLFGATPREATLEWRFPGRARHHFGMSMSFANLEHENDILNYQGAQIAYMGFDELTHFTAKQFFYMLSRNRSTCGAIPCVRATCNPDPDSWVKKFIRWWLDSEGRYADPAKAGKIRYFVRINDVIHWGDTREELLDRFGKDELPTSVTFIPAKLEDNKILISKDPSYRAKLRAMTMVDRARLENGDWLIKGTAGNFFRREWFKVVDAVPAGWTRVIRFWDRAATEPSPENPDPDWTRGLKLYSYPNGKFLVADLKSARARPGQVEELVKTVATHDGTGVDIMSQQDPGSAGVAEADYFVKMLVGYYVTVMTTSKDKATRAKPASAQAEAHNIDVLRGDWNEEFFTELENFSENPDEYSHDDIVDTLSGAFNELVGGASLFDNL